MARLRNWLAKFAHRRIPPKKPERKEQPAVKAEQGVHLYVGEELGRVIAEDRLKGLERAFRRGGEEHARKWIERKAGRFGKGILGGDDPRAQAAFRAALEKELERLKKQSQG